MCLYSVVRRIVTVINPLFISYSSYVGILKQLRNRQSSESGELWESEPQQHLEPLIDQTSGSPHWPKISLQLRKFCCRPCPDSITELGPGAVAVAVSGVCRLRTRLRKPQQRSTKKRLRGRWLLSGCVSKASFVTCTRMVAWQRAEWCCRVVRYTSQLILIIVLKVLI